MDIVTRKKRMDGYNVLFPMGFDAFGLPTENYAIKNHIHPAVVTKQNIARFLPDHRAAAALADALYDLLVGQHALAGGTPVHGHGGLVSQA